MKPNQSPPPNREKNWEEEICPVCGYYCLGKGGMGCIDKPSLVTPPLKQGDKQKKVKIGNRLRDLLARQPETYCRGTAYDYMGELYIANPFSKKDMKSAYQRALSAIKKLL